MPLEVVPGEHELCRLAGRQYAAVVLTADPAEFRQVTALGKVLGDEPPVEVGLQMRDQRQQDDDLFSWREWLPAV